MDKKRKIDNPEFTWLSAMFLLTLSIPTTAIVEEHLLVSQVIPDTGTPGFLVAGLLFIFSGLVLLTIWAVRKREE